MTVYVFVGLFETKARGELCIFFSVENGSQDEKESESRKGKKR